MASSQNPSVLYLGASRGIGFSAYITLATARREVHSVLLLRSVERFKESPEGKSIPSDILSRTTFVKGDALEINTVLEALKAAGDNVEAIVSSIGELQFRFTSPFLTFRSL
jgi:NAD(P)-dependent dehydrogenase (short-subunit alcohol dehydrogenase family)